MAQQLTSRYRLDDQVVGHACVAATYQNATVRLAALHQLSGAALTSTNESTLGRRYSTTKMMRLHVGLRVDRWPDKAPLPRI
ncbi:hypothetical protein DOTSEDRAFT_73922 [Dothistroma septosporum NZE10]|uniref:Uncharacterized protein n=1 Tax=Dothistroma septosporum (strain NZE10 / CBS 128990) TaxID=675120 RepID=N1PHV4_DOTSN|nr:hypothetical protein DOTSEDRAFT_73922 [Dothistroma septosporum NZE10]